MTITSPTASTALRNRTSVYAFDAAATLTDSDLDAVLDAGRHASSWRNSQPWGFIVLRRDTPQFAAFVATLAPGNAAWVPSAGAVVVALHERLHETQNIDSPDYAAYDLGQAVGSMAIEAELLGLDTHQFAGFDHAAARTVLSVPNNWTVVVGLAVGNKLTEARDEATTDLLARDAAKNKARKPITETVFDGTFGVAR